MGNSETAYAPGRSLRWPRRWRRLRASPSREQTPGPALDAGAEGTMRAFLYDADGTDGPVSLEEVDIQRLTSDQLLWLDVSGEHDLASAIAAFGLGNETIQALGEPSTEPALYAHDGYVHIAVVAPGEGPVAHEPRLLDCLVGSNWVVTVHREPIGFLAEFGDRIRGDSDLGKIDGHDFLAAILQEHVASYLAELRPLERELDRVDTRTMAGRMHEEQLLRELVGTRLRLAKLRRLLEPHREFYARLARSEFAVLSGAQSVSDFQALTELLERTLQSMETTREMIVGSFEIYTTWTAHGTNKVMKRLTVASVALLPPTLLAGVMGMNSLPSPLATPLAFCVSTAAMLFLGLGAVTVAWTRKWL